MKRLEMIGKTCWTLRVTGYGASRNGHRYLTCECLHCDSVSEIALSNFQSVKARCSICKPVTHAPHGFKGRKIGRLTVWGRAKGYKKWGCTCRCGGGGCFSTSDLRHFRQVMKDDPTWIASCGRCFAPAPPKPRKEGSTDKRGIWRLMIDRCTNPQNKDYSDYGGRGIRVHQAWIDSFEQFDRDTGPRPPGWTLDRIDPNGNYEPGNVRWASMAEQAKNKRNSRFVEFKNERLTLTDFANLLGLRRGEVARLLKGNTHRPALTPEQIWEIADTRAAWNHLQSEKRARLSTSHTTATIPVCDTEAHAMNPG